MAENVENKGSGNHSVRIASEEKRFVVMDRGQVNTDMIVLNQGSMIHLAEQLESQGEAQAALVVRALLDKGRAFMAEPESYTVDYQCLHCKKMRVEHQAGHCPMPSRSRSFLHYSKTDTYEPNLKKPKKVTFVI
jgi:hypothetical protein